MRRFIAKELESFDDTLFIRLMKIFTGVALVGILYTAVFSGFQIVDEFEHLHAAWLVSIGKVPYLDFFEHHHPLLWYLSAPIVRLFYDDVIVFYVMRAISFGVGLLTIWGLYKIVLFFGDKRAAWCAIALYLGHLITFYNFYQFRPDNFMNLCFVFGVYYWFLSLKCNNLRYLTYSFLWFTFSVLFLQKISLLLIVVEGIILSLIACKKMKVKTVFLAALPAIGVIFVFFSYLFYKGAILQYIELNLKFNQAMVYYFERGAFWYPKIFFSLYGIAFLSAIYFYNKENLYFKIIALLYGAEFLMRAFYFAPHPNYYTTLTFMAAGILSVYVKRLMPKHKLITLGVLFLMFLNLGKTFNTVDASAQKHNSFAHYKLADYVHKNSASDDLLMNGYDMNFNIYREDVSYYWFGLDMLLPVIENEYDMKGKVDINALMLQYRPKFIYTEDYVDLMALRTYGETKYSQRFIGELVELLYKPTPFKNLAVLK